MTADSETLVLSATVIAGDRLVEDYQVIWRGLSIGRIMKTTGVPSSKPRWSWGCNVYGKRQLTNDKGIGVDLLDAKAKFMIAWERIRPGLTNEDIAKAHRYAKSKRQRSVQMPKTRKPCRMGYRDELAILEMAAASNSVDEIAFKLGRRPKAILRKAMDLGLFVDQAGPRGSRSDDEH